MAAPTAARAGQGGGAGIGIRNPPHRILITGALAAVLLLAGGASRYDEPQQIPIRLVAIAAIAAILWRLDTAPLEANRKALYAAAAAYALILLQMVPLPPEIWAQLPGRAVYADIARTSGEAGWRPLSLTPDLTLNALFALLPAAAAGLAALYLHYDARRLLWTWVVGGALFSATLGLVQLGVGGHAFRFYRETSLDSAVGVFANRNHQAAFLACALPLAGALAGQRLRNGGDWRTVGAAVAAVVGLLLLSIIATRSRTGLALAALGTASGFWAFRAAGASVKAGGRARIVAAAMAAVLLAGVGFAAIRSGVAERLLLTDPAAETRAEMLKPLVRTAEAFFPIGSGFGSFDSVYRRFEPDSLLSTIYMNQAHNEPMQLAIEGGLPALALLALFVAWWLRTAVNIVRADIPSKRRSIAIAAIAITAMLMLASLVDYPLRTPLLGALFAAGCVEMMRAAAVRRRPADTAAASAS